MRRDLLRRDRRQSLPGHPAGLHVTFNFRDGPFFSLIFFVTGYFLHKRDYVAGTYFFGVGVALIALSDSPWLPSPRLAAIGPYVRLTRRLVV